VRPLVTTCLCLLLGAACTDPVDKAAKKRIFSPEDPPQAVSAASQKLPPEDVADNPEIARRVLGMGAAEATERIGAHQFTATVSYEWSAQGSKNVLLKETRTLLAGSGGVGGDFHATVENSRDQGLEVIRIQNAVFARSRYGKFRQRLRDRGIAERVREEMYGAIKDFDALFRGRLKLAASGTITYEGRTAWKYTVSLGEARPEKAQKLPALVGTKGGVDETTQRRLAFYELRTPKALQGEVLVDALTSVVLKTRLDGRLGVKREARNLPDGGVESEPSEADLRLVLDSQLQRIGAEPALKTPEGFLPDQDKPEGIAATLERFGIVRAGADGGTAGPSDVVPDDEDAP
jgi:hypothetical protein